MTIIATLLLIIQISVFLTVMSYGLRSNLTDVFYLLRSPGYLLRAMLSIFVIMPIVSVALVKLIGLDSISTIALVSIAISPIPPFLPKNVLRRGGPESDCYGLLAITGLLSVFVIPFAFRIFGAIFQRDGHFPELEIIKIISMTVLLPITVGMVIRRIAPAFSERIAGLLGTIGLVLLIAAFLPLFGGFFPMIWALIGNGAVLAFLAFALVGVVVGHWLGGAEPDDRVVLAITTSTRQPAIAMALVGASVVNSDMNIATSAIMLYALSSAAVALPYLAWLTGTEKALKAGKLA
jgi:BASS family bile acid:Na+ symporter